MRPQTSVHGPASVVQKAGRANGCPARFALLRGEMSEWSKEHAWRACRVLKALAGSNPALSATRLRRGGEEREWEQRLTRADIGRRAGDGLVLRGGNL